MKKVVFCSDWDEAAAFNTDPAVHVPSWAEAFQRYGAEIGIEFTDHMWRQITKDVIGRAEPKEVAEFVRRANQLGMPNLTSERLYEVRKECVGYWTGPKGALSSPSYYHDAVEAISSHGGTNCIVTGSGSFILDRMLHWLKLDRFFQLEHRICSDDHRILEQERFKPDVFPWELALREADASDGDIKIFLEDSLKVTIPLAQSPLFDYGFLLVKDAGLKEERRQALRNAGIPDRKVQVVTDLGPMLDLMRDL